MKNVKKGHTRPVVCLDAGHYGKYNQSDVVPEYYESDMNWKLHNLLAEELEAFGIEVKKTRTSQAKDLGLYKRGEASKGCDLFLSIHSNAAGAEKVDRPEGIYLVDDKKTDIDEQSKELAVLLSGVVAKVMQTKDKPKNYSRLAGMDLNGDGLDNDNYYGVLHGARKVGTAGIILEHSFHTNTRAAKWLLDDDNLAKLAKTEAEAIAAYFGVEKGQEEPVEKYYRVRRSWEDAASQVGAYKTLANAKKACKEGFTVYDWNGVAVYSVAAAEAEAVKLDYPKSLTKAYDATYRVKSVTGLNLRAGASMNKAVLEEMPNGSTFRCYGYHTNRWLYGVSASGKKGFCSKAYLVKE